MHLKSCLGTIDETQSGRLVILFARDITLGSAAISIYVAPP